MSIADPRDDRLRLRIADLEAENARLLSAGLGWNAEHIRSEIAGTDTGTDPFFAAVRATRMPMVVSDPRERDNPIVFANDAFCRLTGYARGEILGRNCRFLQGPGTDPATIARIRAAIDVPEPIEIDIRNHRKDGSTFWNRLLMAPVRDVNGDLTYFFASQLDVSLERERLTDLESHNAALMAEVAGRLHAQQESEAKLRFATEAGRLGVWDFDLGTGELETSATCRDNFGRDASAPFTYGDLKAAVHPEDEARRQAALDHTLVTGADYDAEYRILRPDGAIGALQVRAQLVRSADGTPQRLVGVSLDITGRKAAEVQRLALIDLADAFRDLDDPADIAFTAARIIGQTLGASRAGYGTIDPVAETITIERDWTAPGIASLAGVLHFRDYGSYIDDLKRGEMVVFGDARTDPRTAASAAALEAIGARSVVNMPIVEQGGFVALLYLNQAGIRDWTVDDLGFVREFAHRTRLAVERHRAQHDLRRLAASLEQRVEERTRERDQAWKYSQDLQAVVDTDGTFLAVNAAWTTMLGWATGEVVGRNHLEFNDPDHRDASREALAIASHTNLPAYETRCLHKDGSTRWISWVATVEGGRIYASGRNITIEKEAARALRVAESRIRSIFETTYQLLGFLSPDGILLDANPASLDAIEAARGDVVGRPFWDTPWFAATPGMGEQVRAAVARAAEGETVRQEVTVILPSGPRSYDFSVRPVIDELGRVIGLVLEAVDLTDQRQAEEALRQSQKMEAVGQLTGGLAHDFNNLLTGISGSLEMMQTRLGQGRFTELERYATAAQSASKRAAALTHRLLAFSRRQTLAPKPTDANRLITGMEDLIRRTVGPAIRLDVAGAKGLWITLVDPPQLENALLNLCINARDAMQEGGRLTIETGNRRFDERAARERELEPGQYVSVCVRDTGCGMKPEVIARAFDPFFTTKPTGMGTGLGLSMIYGFAKQSGGQVRISSEIGQGSTVCLYLPRHRGRAERAYAPAFAEASRAGRGETVLVVDDEPSVRMLVIDVLEEHGYAAVEASDGVSGLSVLRSDARVDLLVTDVGLPNGMNGRQVADAGRALRPSLKVLFITGYGESAILGDGPLEPGMQVMTKPFAIEDLAGRIKDLINAK